MAAKDVINNTNKYLRSGKTHFSVADVETMHYPTYEGYYVDLSDVLTDAQFAESKTNTVFQN